MLNWQYPKQCLWMPWLNLQKWHVIAQNITNDHGSYVLDIFTQINSKCQYEVGFAK